MQICGIMEKIIMVPGFGFRFGAKSSSTAADRAGQGGPQGILDADVEPVGFLPEAYRSDLPRG